MPQLDLGAKLDIAGEQPQHGGVGECLDILNEFMNSRAGLAAVAFQNLVQPEYIRLKENAEILIIIFLLYTGKYINNMFVTHGTMH